MHGGEINLRTCESGSSGGASQVSHAHKMSDPISTFALPSRTTAWKPRSYS